MRSTRWLVSLTVLAGGSIIAAATAAGCGGKTDEPGGTTPPVDAGSEISVITDTGTPDTSKPDTGSTKPDTGTKTYDAPGSLFDVSLPDVVFDNGTSLGGCYGCTTEKCKAEVETCDKDPRCRGFLLCVTVSCGGKGISIECAAPCAIEYDVDFGDPFSDPAVVAAIAIGQCTQKNCADKCPAIDAGASPPPADTGTKADGAADFKPGSFKIDRAKVTPQFLDAVRQIVEPFEKAPECRQGLVDHLSTPVTP